MNTMTKRTSTSVLLAAALTLAATAFADLQMHGRVSFDGGGVVVRGQADADWGRAGVNTLLMPGHTVWVDNGGATEIELAGGTFLRLADDSKVELASLPPAAELRGGPVLLRRHPHRRRRPRLLKPTLPIITKGSGSRRGPFVWHRHCSPPAGGC